MTKVELSDEERTPCEIFSRVMGYLRPVSFYNIGKKGEFYKRRNFDEKRALDKADSYTKEK